MYTNIGLSTRLRPYTLLHVYIQREIYICIYLPATQCVKMPTRLATDRATTASPPHGHCEKGRMCPDEVPEWPGRGPAGVPRGRQGGGRQGQAGAAVKVSPW
jgi:hypothetical protein